MRVRLVLLLAPLCLSMVPNLPAQDAAKADPAHYKVLSENDQVRILKVHYGRGEKSVMHSHPDSVAVYLSNAKVKMTFPDGKTQEAEVKAGEAQFTPAATHLPQNIGTKEVEMILVELKGKGGS
jgi:quercetin dioxygenase-like cupin family protein